MTDARAIEVWFKATLTGDETLAALIGTRVYRDRIPQKGTQIAVQSAAVVINQVSSGNENAVSGARVASTPLWQVKAVVEGDPETADSIAEQIDILIHAAKEQPIDDRFILSCIREQEVTSSEVTSSGTRFYHTGGLYRIFIGH